MNNTKINCFIFTALPCEAKAFITQFKLKKDLNSHPFSLYYHEQIALTITGSGKVAMAAALAYTLAIFESIEHPVLINAGIAGHQTATLAQLVSVHKITDMESGNNYYPQSVINIDCLSLPAYTVCKPDKHYQLDGLYEMEASGFYETATRFTSTELIQIFKVISDNQVIGIEAINAKKVNIWMAASIEKIAVMIQNLQVLANCLLRTNPGYDTLLQKQYYFNSNQSHQLNALLQRWNVLTNNAELNIPSLKFQHSKAVLQWLQQQIDNQVFIL